MFDDRQTDTPVGDTTAADVDNEVPNKRQGVQADVPRRQTGLTFSLTHESEKNFSSLSSRSVRRQKRVCSKGRIFLMATSLLVGLWRAATTVPYAPSPSPWRIL